MDSKIIDLNLEELRGILNHCLYEIQIDAGEFVNSDQDLLETI